ncbi:MAG: PilN domain-containing protein [Planctomycetota bacterium]
MSAEQFDLVPASIRSRVACGRRSRQAYFASTALGLATLAVLGGSQWLENRSSLLLRDAQATAGPALELVAETERLRAQAADLAGRIDLQRAVGVQIPASGLMQAVARSLPEGTTLERISLEFKNIQGSARKARKAVRAEQEPRELRGEIAGIAASEEAVGALVDRLEQVAPFSQVSLESSRSLEFRGRAAREFRVGFRVDLEKRWTMPAIADGTDGGAP